MLTILGKYPVSQKSNLLPHYLAKRKWSTIHIYVHISESNVLHVRRHLFHEFLFVYLYDVIMTLVQYFIYFITHFFQLRYEDKRLTQH